MARFAFVTELYWPHIGGQEVRYRELSSYLVKCGHTVHVLTISTDPSLPRVETIDGIEIRRLVISPSYKKTRLKRNPITILQFSIITALFLLRRRYDYVVFNQWPVLPQILFGRLVRGRALMDWCEHRSGLFYRVLFQLCAWSTSRHICVSSSLGDLLRSRYGLRHLAVIPSGIERSSYSPDKHKSGLLFVGRLARHKHPEMLVDAVELLAAKGYVMQLTIAGDGPMLEDIKLLTKGRKHIQVLGKVTESRKRSLLATSWLHVLPSEREGFPRIIAEAMASGTPTLTVSSPDNGAKAIVSQYNCGLVTRPTAAALAQSIAELANQRSVWDELSFSGLKHSEQLDWRAVTGRFVDFLTVEPASLRASDT